MYLIAALRMAPSPLLKHMGLRLLSGHKFSTLQDIVFFYAAVLHPSYVPEKCQGLLGVRGKRAVAVSVQLAESEEPQPALWVRNAFWLCWSADQSHIKRRSKLILLFKYYAIGYCHWGDFSTHSSWLSWSLHHLKGLFHLNMSDKTHHLSKWRVLMPQMYVQSSYICHTFTRL